MNGLTPAEAAQLGIAITIALIGGGFITWGLWVALTGLYDHFVGHHKRRRNRRFDVGSAL